MILSPRMDRTRILRWRDIDRFAVLQGVLTCSNPVSASSAERVSDIGIGFITLRYGISLFQDSVSRQKTKWVKKMSTETGHRRMESGRG